MKRLLSKLFKEKITWEFSPAEQEELTEELRNPARGWYTIYPFLLEEEPDFEELVWCLKKEETLALVIINIGAYREQALEEEALERIRRILRFFSEHFYDVILRLVYDHEGNAVEREPFFFKQVLEHLNQLVPVVKEYSDCVFIWQGMLIGNWGEMHTSRFLSPDKLKQLWSIQKNGLGDRVFLAVRRPSMWRLLHPEECGKACPAWNSTGLFDDAIFGSESHMGTFGRESRENAAWDGLWSRQDELNFEEQLCLRVPNGGEAVCGEDYAEKLTPSAVAGVLRQMHVTYLNQAYDENILNLWKNMLWEESGIWQNCSLYDYVGRHLGYRFCIREVSVMRHEKTEELQVIIKIENIGFANCYQEAEVFIEWVDKEGKSGIVQPVCDIRSWDSGTIQTVTGSLAVKTCELYLSLRRKTDGRAIYFANRADAAGRVLLGKITEI